MNHFDLKEFEQFLEGNVAPPAELNELVCNRIKKALNPPLGGTVAKLFSLHVLGSLATLFLCQQFSIGIAGPVSLFTGKLMSINPGLCFVGCGALWVAGGQTLSQLILTFDEQRILGAYRYASGFTFILLSLLAFACFGSLDFNAWLLWWLIGALGTATVFFAYSNQKIKRIFARA